MSYFAMMNSQVYARYSSASRTCCHYNVDMSMWWCVENIETPLSMDGVRYFWGKIRDL